MNILHTVNIYFVIPYFLGDQLLFFKRKGYNEHIICSPSPEIKEYSISHGFQYEEIPILRKVSIKGDLAAIRKIRRYIKTHKINIVTGHTPKGALLGIIAAWLEKVPKRIYFRHGLVFETSHGTKRKILIALDKITSKLATHIINVSPSVAQRSLEENLNSPDKQFILHKGTCNGIPIHKFNKDILDITQIHSLQKELRLENSFVIGYTGRLVKDKGIIELIQAFKILREDYPFLKLLLVGMFEERDVLPTEMVDFIKNNSDIIHVGYVSYESIEYYYALMDVFVLLSYREGFPTSALEASAMNLPVITTKATGCIDSIVEKETGLFVNHTIEEIVSALKYFIENESQKRVFGSAGREFVKNNFASEIIWKEIEKIYQQ